MSRYLLFAVIALGIGLSIWEIANRGAQAYERMLVARVSNGLEVLGFDWAEIKADGLKLEIHGHAPDTFARELALESARATAPIATVTSYATATLAPPERRDPVRVELLRDQRGVTMTGQTASRAMRQRVNDALKERDRALTIQDLTGIQAAQPPRGWGAEITVATMAAAALANAYVVMEPGQVLIDGQAASSEERAALTESLREAAGERVVLVLRIRIPASVIAPFTFAAQKDAGLGLRLETCAVRTEEEQVLMGKVLKRLGPSERLSLCRVGLGGPGGDWTGAIAAGVDALEALPAGRIEIEYRVARLSGLPPTSPAIFDEVSARFAAALPDGFEAETALHADDVATRTGIARDLYWMTASRSPEGVTISGQVPDGTAAQAVSAYAVAIFGGERVVHDLRVVDRPAPPDWQIAAMGTLDQLALSDGGEARMAGYRVSLRARITDPALAGQIHRELVNGLPDYEISSSFEVDLPEKLAGIPMPGPRRVHESVTGQVHGLPPFALPQRLEEGAPRGLSDDAGSSLGKQFDASFDGAAHRAGHPCR